MELSFTLFVTPVLAAWFGGTADLILKDLSPGRLKTHGVPRDYFVWYSIIFSGLVGAFITLYWASSYSDGFPDQATQAFVCAGAGFISKNIGNQLQKYLPKLFKKFLGGGTDDDAQ